MTLKQLKEKLTALQTKQVEAFNTMVESATDDNIKAYEESIKVCKVIEDQISAMEKDALDEEGVPAGIQEGSALTEDAKTFIRKIQEAVAVGSSYTGLIPTTISSEIIKKREQYGKLRPLARKMTLKGDYTVAIDGDQVTVEYVAEAGAIPEKNASVGTVSISAYKLGALVKVSHEFLTDLAIDAMTWLTDNIARAFAKKEDNEILNGTGSTNSHITGILTTVDTDAVTAEAVDAVTLDEVKTLIGSLGDYAEGSVLIMNEATRTKLSLLKDLQGQYYFPIQSDLKEIQGHKIVTSQYMPVMGADTRAIIACNMDYYMLIDREQMDIKVLNELFAVNDQKGVIGIERVDGKVLVADAFKVLKMASAG